MNNMSNDGLREYLRDNAELASMEIFEGGEAEIPPEIFAWGCLEAATVDMLSNPPLDNYTLVTAGQRLRDYITGQPWNVLTARFSDIKDLVGNGVMEILCTTITNSLTEEQIKIIEGTALSIENAVIYKIKEFMVREALWYSVMLMNDRLDPTGVTVNPKTFPILRFLEEPRFKY